MFVSFLVALIVVSALMLSAQGQIISTVMSSPTPTVDPRSVFVDTAGTIFLGSNSLVYSKAVGGSASLYAGGGSSFPPNNVNRLTAQFNEVLSISGSNDKLYIGSYYYIYQINQATNTVTILLGTGSNGNDPDGTYPGTSIRVFMVRGIAVDTAGKIYFSDYEKKMVRCFNPSNNALTTIAGNLAGTGGTGGNNVLATSIMLNTPTGVYVSSTGAVYIAENGGHRVSKVVSGTLTTFAGTGSTVETAFNRAATSAGVPYAWGLGGDAMGNIFIGYGANRILKVDSTGYLTVFAGTGSGGAISGDGGLATSAVVNGNVVGVVTDTAGNVYFTQTTPASVRMVTNGIPTVTPTVSPTRVPTRLPTKTPTWAPTYAPSSAPTCSNQCVLLEGLVEENTSQLAEATTAWLIAKQEAEAAAAAAAQAKADLDITEAQFAAAIDANDLALKAQDAADKVEEYAHGVKENIEKTGVSLTTALAACTHA